MINTILALSMGEKIGIGVGVGAAVLLIIIFIAVWISLRNKLFRLKNQVEEAWSTIDVQLKKRYDLIPNLVETVKGYAKHESGTLEAVIKARNIAISAKTTDEKINAENALSGTLKSLFKLKEAYPELKANENYQQLMNELAMTENQIAQYRNNYNEQVRSYNKMIRSFPSNIILSMLGYEKIEATYTDYGAPVDAPQNLFD